MPEGNTVFLLVGQRGSGKSHYAKRLVEKQPDVHIVSRDEILVRLYGSVHTDPYIGSHHYAYELMNRIARRKLLHQHGLKLILDCWTGDSRERKALIRKLREYGANRVVALYFMTPLELVNIWFWQKPGIAKAEEWKARKDEGLVFFSAESPSNDYRLFHHLAAKIDSDGFDEIIRIDPQKEPIALQ